jgi:glycosyltransferase involved in cell wall biosynthesis
MTPNKLSASSVEIALFLPFLGGRGANRVMLNLANGFADKGLRVDLVLAEARGEFIDMVVPAVRVIDFASRGVLRSLPSFSRYLRRERPRILLTAMDYVNVLSILVRALVAPQTRMFITCHNSLLNSVRNSPWLRDRLLPFATRLTYPHADGVIAVSRGVAQTLSSITGIAIGQIKVIHNPVVTPTFAAQAAAVVDHRWFAPGSPPVVLGAGSLTKQKDFETLIRAFAQVHTMMPMRLMILGEGEERRNLESLVARLDLQGEVELPGFVENPFAYMARAAVFVLSSRWEGFGLALAEALACGTPVISTDCPSGPAEILEGGNYGALIPVQHPQAMAKAIVDALAREPNRAALKQRGYQFSLERVVAEYLACLDVRGKTPA